MIGWTPTLSTKSPTVPPLPSVEVKIENLFEDPVIRKRFPKMSVFADFWGSSVEGGNSGRAETASLPYPFRGGFPRRFDLKTPRPRPIVTVRSLLGSSLSLSELRVGAGRRVLRVVEVRGRRLRHFLP